MSKIFRRSSYHPIYKWDINGYSGIFHIFPYIYIYIYTCLYIHIYIFHSCTKWGPHPQRSPPASWLEEWNLKFPTPGALLFPSQPGRLALLILSLGALRSRIDGTGSQMISDQIGRGWVLADDAQIFAFAADSFSGPTVLAIAPTVDVIVLLLFFSWQISEGLRFHNVYMNIIYMHIYMIRNITLYIYTHVFEHKSTYGCIITAANQAMSDVVDLLEAALASFCSVANRSVIPRHQ